jgi:hypothetical protein
MNPYKTSYRKIYNFHERFIGVDLSSDNHAREEFAAAMGEFEGEFEVALAVAVYEEIIRAKQSR